MLLGFVNKAIEYLDSHIDEEIDPKFSELQNIDLVSLKDKLNSNIDASLGNMQSTVDLLLKAGEEAFEQFIDSSEKEDLTSEFNRLFDDAIEDNDEITPSDEEKSISDLLAFYNLIDEPEDVNDDSDNDSEILSISSELEEYLGENKSEEDIESEFEDFVGTDNTDRPIFDENEIRESFDSFVGQTIKDNNIQNIDEEALERAFEEFVGSLRPVYEEEEPEFSEDETVFEMSKEDDELLARIAENVNKIQDNYSDEENQNDDEDAQLDDLFSKVVSNENEQLDEFLKDTVNIEEQIKVSDEMQRSDQVQRDDILELLREMEISNEIYYKDIPDPFEQAKQEYFNDDIYEEIPIENESEEYVSDLIDNLKEKMIKEDEQRKQAEDEFNQVYDKIHSTYPYLSSDFIKIVYDLKDSIADEYPLGISIIVLHRIVFKDLDNLRQFVEIALNHDYSINADENKMIVDIFKEYVNTDGKIITSIFEVANQSALLNGEYDGYRVLYAKKV